MRCCSDILWKSLRITEGLMNCPSDEMMFWNNLRVWSTDDLKNLISAVLIIWWPDNLRMSGNVWKCALLTDYLSDSLKITDNLMLWPSDVLKCLRSSDISFRQIFKSPESHSIRLSDIVSYSETIRFMLLLSVFFRSSENLSCCWCISSKSRATIFFKSDTFFWEWWIVSQPKVGTWQNLCGTPVSSATEFAMANKLSHLQSSSAKTVPLRLFTMWSKCMKIDFQTPSSNSCSKSTTSMRKKSKPAWPSLSKNVFWTTIIRHFWFDLETLKHTTVGTRDSSLRRASTWGVSMTYCSSYINWCTVNIFSHLSAVLHQARMVRCNISVLVTTSWNLTFRITHWGHGHLPRLRILAMRTL